MQPSRFQASAFKPETAVHLLSTMVLAFSLSACFEGGLVSPRDSASLLDQTTDSSSSGTSASQSTAIELLSIEPNSGSALGGAQIRLIGRNFRQSTVILVDGKTCAATDYINSKEIRCTTRAHSSGTVDIEVRNLRSAVDGLDGIIRAELKQAFTYLDAQAPSVMTAGIGGGRSKNSGGTIIMDARIGEIGAAAVGNTQGESASRTVILRAGNINAGATQ